MARTYDQGLAVPHIGATPQHREVHAPQQQRCQRNAARAKQPAIIEQITPVAGVKSCWPSRVYSSRGQETRADQALITQTRGCSGSERYDLFACQSWLLIMETEASSRTQGRCVLVMRPAA